MKLELDKRIYEDRRIIFTCFTAEDAKKYVGQKGFFADEIHTYQDLDFTDFGTLDRVDNDAIPFKSGSLFYQFFLPAEFVKELESEKEKKFRPYTLEEFCGKFTVGRPINFRKKDNVGNEQYLILNGYITVKEFDRTVHYIYIGSASYILNELFSEYEWQELSTHDWTPFGVEE